MACMPMHADELLKKATDRECYNKKMNKTNKIKRKEEKKSNKSRSLGIRYMDWFSGAQYLIRASDAFSSNQFIFIILCLSHLISHRRIWNRKTTPRDI